MKEVFAMNKKLRKKDKIILGVLIALIIIVIGVGAFLIIRNTNAANKQTEKTSSGASSSQITSSTETSSSSKKPAATKPSAKTATENASSPDNNSSASSSLSSSASSTSSGGGSSSKTSSKTSKTSKSSKTSSKKDIKGDKVKRVKPKENTSHASSNVLSVNGKNCYVGDTITIVMNITSQKSIINYQGYLEFDNKYLKIKDVKSNSFGMANSNGSEVLYNASAINGMDFSETGTVFTATFEVKETGSTKVNNNLEIISELVGNNIKQLSPSDYEVSVEIYD